MQININWNSFAPVDGIDRTGLKKELKARGIDYSQIDNWSASSAQGRGTAKIKEIKWLDNQNTKFVNRNAEQVKALFKKQVQLTEAYQRFVPEQLLESLDKKSILDVQLGNQVQKEMTILFSDIRSFTNNLQICLNSETYFLVISFKSYLRYFLHPGSGYSVSVTYCD